MTTYRRCTAYVAPEWLWLSCLAAVMLLLVALGTLQAWPLALLIDVLSGHTPEFLKKLCGEREEMAVGALVVGFFLIKFAQDGLSLCRSMLSLRIKYHVTKRVRRDMCRQIHTLGHVHFKTHSQGDTLFRISNDCFGPYGICETILTTIQALCSFLSIVAVMWMRNGVLTSFALSMAPFLALANWHFGKRIRRRAGESREVDADMLTLLQRSLSTLLMTQLCARRSHEELNFEQAQNKSIGTALQLNWQENLYPYCVQTIYGIGQATILAVGAWLVIRSQHAGVSAQVVTCGDLVLFVTYFNQIVDPLSLVIGFGARVKSSVVASERVFEFLDSKPAVTDAAHPLKITIQPRELKIDKVWFTHASQEAPVICGLSANFRPCEMTAIVGSSGSGKSTLIDLIARFYDPSSGSIYLNKFDLRHLSVESIRRHVAVVSQCNLVIAGTIFENIAYGNPAASEADILHAAAQAGMDQFIAQLPDGYQTELSEGGQTLSGGQRQRIAIARALATQAPIIVLDEPTSALDQAQEQALVSRLKMLKRDRTIILVTHSPRVAAECDRIMVMRHGRIFEQGTHAALLAQRGLYFSLTKTAPDAVAGPIRNDA